MAKAGRAENSAYGIGQASVTDHAVWFLWPNTTLMRYPGRGNFMLHLRGARFDIADGILKMENSTTGDIP